MTERDSDYERWQAALLAIQEVSSQYREVSGQYQLLLKAVQNGFGSLSMENAAIRQRLTQIEAELVQIKNEFRAMSSTFQQLLPHMAEIAAYVVRIQAPPQSRPRPRRANGE